MTDMWQERLRASTIDDGNDDDDDDGELKKE